MKKEVKPILLPQTCVKDYTLGNILKSDYRMRVSNNQPPEDDDWEEPYHLYIVDESSPIITDMWSKLPVGTAFIRADNNRRKGKWEALHELGYLENKQRAYDPSGYQILATTDYRLIADGVPAISQEFIREYVQVQGKGVVSMEFESRASKTVPIAYNTDWIEYIPKLDNAGKVVLSIGTKETVNPLVADALRTVPDFGKEVKSNIPEDQRAAYMLAMENIIAGKESIKNLDVMREMFLAGVQWQKEQSNIEVTKMLKWINEQGWYPSEPMWCNGEASSDPDGGKVLIQK